MQAEVGYCNNLMCRQILPALPLSGKRQAAQHSTELKELNIDLIS